MATEVLGVTRTRDRGKDWTVVWIAYPEFHKHDVPCRGKTDLWDALDMTEGYLRWKYMNKCRELCAICPVMEECREYALAHETEGLWGGMSERDRHKERRRRGWIVTDPRETHLFFE